MSGDDITRRTALRLSGAALVAAGLGTATVSAQPGTSPNAVFDLDFSTAADAADNTATSAGWVVDRQAPEGWSAVNGALEIDIDETGPTSGFYRYQGKKYQDADGTYWYAGDGSTRFSYDFYVDPEWETDDDPQETGVWPTLGNADGNISAYPILAYQDSTASDTGSAQFRTYVYRRDSAGDLVGEWVDLGLPKRLGIDPVEGGWVSVEAQLHSTGDGSALKWRVNNKLVYDERNYNAFSPSTQFLEFIFNSVNFGNDETYRYDNIRLTEPGHAGKGQ